MISFLYEGWKPPTGCRFGEGILENAYCNRLQIPSTLKFATGCKFALAPNLQVGDPSLGSSSFPSL
jgi:hypothetical protein